MTVEYINMKNKMPIDRKQKSRVVFAHFWEAIAL